MESLQYNTPLQSLLLRYMAENLQATLFEYALSAHANKIFQSELFLCLPKVDHVIN